AIVVIEPLGPLLYATRATDHRHALPVAGRFLAANRNFLLVVFEVMADEEIEPAIAVVVDPGATRSITVARMPQFGALRYVFELAITFVVEQDVLPHAGDEQVVPAVVIVIADRHAGRPHAASKTRLRRHVFERAVAIVVIKTDSGFGRRRAGLALAGEDDDILPAVIVVVDKRCAASHRAQDVIDVTFVTVDHRRRQAGLFGHIDEVRMERNSGRFAARSRL